MAFVNPSLSVAIVCKNNAGTIGRTLESVKGIATEIVAVDSGSTDGTIELLERYGARIIRSEWLGHVKTKQIALEACTCDWVLCLDSDESISKELRKQIRRRLKRDDGEVHAWAIRRFVYYREVLLNSAWQPEWRVRLVRRGRARWTGLDPHDELVTIDCEPGPANQRPFGHIRHDSIGTWADFLAKQVEHAKTMATSLHAAGKTTSVLRLATSPAGAFFKQLVLKRAYRDGWPGWVAAASTALGTLAKHAILLELTRSTPTTNELDESRPKTLQSGPERTDA